MTDPVSYLNYHASTVQLSDASSASSSSASSSSSSSSASSSSLNSLLKSYTPNETIRKWIAEAITLCNPSRLHLCDGSESENFDLLKLLVHGGVLIPLNATLRPNSFLARSPPSDVARVEERTFICADTKEHAGYTNNWCAPDEMHAKLNTLFTGCMKGRTMFVVPFCMGPLHSPFSEIGIQITDSAYVVVNMRIMTRMGNPALRMLDDGKKKFVPAMHSVGMPLTKNEADSTWPSNPDNKYIVHFPLEKSIWSYGSGYGGNALLGKKCFALRIASTIGREDGWLAEHMLIVGITNPQGVKKYVCAAFPSACGKTNLAMLEPKLPGWKVECVGDDIAWLRLGPDGRLYAVNPESGFFGVAPGTSMETNPNAMRALKSNSIFTNVAMKADGDIYWEGMQKTEPDVVTSWLRTERYAGSGWEAAHPNSRFTAPARQCPVMDANWENPAGVPISAIIFGGRRSTVMPLVYQSRSWAHGVFVGASMTSETTAAAAGARGVLRADPFAMRPFCGYNMADYFAHWLSFETRTDPSKLPKVFHVNWFRKSSKTNKIIWPGFGENIRVLDWILRRCDVPAAADSLAVDTPLGFEPHPSAINIDGLNLSAESMAEVLSLDDQEWIQESKRTREFFANFGSTMPPRILSELDDVEARFKAHYKSEHPSN